MLVIIEMRAEKHSCRSQVRTGSKSECLLLEQLKKGICNPRNSPESADYRCPLKRIFVTSDSDAGLKVKKSGGITYGEGNVVKYLNTFGI